MKILFDDGSYVDIMPSPTPHKFYISVASKDPGNTNSLTINTAEITEEEFIAMFKENLGIKYGIVKNKDNNKEEENKEEEKDGYN